MDDGKITELSIQDVYELDNRYYDEIPVPLHELRGLTPNWRLRDSNAFVDFPSTAEQAMWFYEEEAGQTVDGVIAINLSTAQALLELTGPVTLPSAGKELSAADFPAVMSTLVEAKVAGPQPKSILSEFIDSFMQALKTRTELYPQLGSLLLEQMEKKQLLVYHRSAELQDFITSLGLSASIPKLSTLEGDFALPVFTSMGANKTERYMSTKLYHDTQILGDRAIVNQFTIERTHQFNAATLAWLKNRSAAFGFTAWNQDLENLLGAGVNRTGVRIYLPEGAQILNVSGDVHRNDLQFKYDAENDISYYFLDQSIEAGESQTLSIQYALPWLHDEDFGGYQFQLFKQPGFKNVSFQKTVTASGRDLLSSTEPASFADPNVDYVLEGPLHSDVDLELLFR